VKSRSGRMDVSRTSAIAIVGLVGVVLAIGGLGYAASAGNSLLNSGGDLNGRVNLLWTNPNHVSGSAPFVHCQASFSSTILSLVATNLAPGTHCSLSGTILNSGQLPASLDAFLVFVEPRSCQLFVYSDNVLNLAIDPTVAAGGTFSYQAALSLGPSAGNSCQGQTASLLVFITSGETCGGSIAEMGCE